MYKDQKFRRGDLVRSSRYGEVIVLGSYADLCHGKDSDIHEFSVLFPKDGGSLSWCNDTTLTFIEHVGEDKIREIKDTFKK